MAGGPGPTKTASDPVVPAEVPPQTTMGRRVAGSVDRSRRLPRGGDGASRLLAGAKARGRADAG